MALEHNQGVGTWGTISSSYFVHFFSILEKVATCNGTIPVSWPQEKNGQKSFYRAAIIDSVENTTLVGSPTNLNLSYFVLSM